MKRRCLFLDRDGVINEEKGFVGKTKDDFVFVEGVFPFLRFAQDCGYRLVIVTNQSGVARGYYTVSEYEALTGWMLESLRCEGIVLDAVMGCFEYEGGNIPPYNRASFWRKPNAGMILEAAARLNIDVSRSAMIGDKESDRQAALAAGVGRFFPFGAMEGAFPNFLAIEKAMRAG